MNIATTTLFFWEEEQPLEVAAAILLHQCVYAAAAQDIKQNLNQEILTAGSLFRSFRSSWQLAWELDFL